MIPGLHFPTQRPASAAEAVLLANQTLQSAGLRSSNVTLREPATAPDGFTGAVLEASLPESDLAALFAMIAAAKATEQGGKVSDCTLTLESTSPKALKVHCGLVAKMMMATLQLQLSAELYQIDRKHLGVRQISFNPGSGMFASMATAMIRPRLAEFEGKTISLESLLGLPVEIVSLGVENHTLRLCLSA